MHETIKNLRLKEYNPCGDLTGFEHDFCDGARKEFFTLPFEQVMRTALARWLGKLEQENNLRNVDALKHWASYNLNDIERRVVITFETSSTLQIGLAKYLTHLLYENRYNIHYNELVYFCRTLDEKIFPDDMTSEELERKIDYLAQTADYSTTYKGLNEDFINSLAGGGVNVADILCDVLSALA